MVSIPFNCKYTVHYFIFITDSRKNPTRVNGCSRKLPNILFFPGFGYRILFYGKFPGICVIDSG